MKRITLNCVLIALVLLARDGGAMQHGVMPQIINASTFRVASHAGRTVVDVRSREDYARGHVAGAVSVPMMLLEARAESLLAFNREIVFYCACVDDKSSHAAAELLLGKKPEAKVAIVRGGWNALVAAGVETRVGEAPF